MIMDSTDVPITERSNSITKNIDTATPAEIVVMFEKCDIEMFEGWNEHPSLTSEQTTATIDNLIRECLQIFEMGEYSAIVLGGCGTSGRIGFIVSRTFNMLLEELERPPQLEYIMAGGDTALFSTFEIIEDDPIAGMEILEKLTCEKTKVLYIGITCGLSAPFVMGQIDHCLNNTEKFIPVLLGFNPTHLARNTEIEKWNKTCRDVVMRLESAVERNQAYILNPILGPEPITGSSRMKGASATKLLLEIIFTQAICKIMISNHQTCRDTVKCIHQYRNVCDAVYNERYHIAQLIENGGHSLNNGGRIFYISWSTLGIMGMVDASECIPTFGSAFDDVRGFVNGGYTLLRNKDGDMSHEGDRWDISLQTFQRTYLQNLSNEDMVVFLLCERDSSPEKEELLKIIESKCKSHRITFGCHEAGKIQNPFGAQDEGTVNISILEEPIDSLYDNALCRTMNCMKMEYAAKLLCNAVSTGSHVLKGKVYQNIMIDLNISNNKLFHRGINIIKEYGKLPTLEEAMDYLLKAIYNTDNVTDDLRSQPISQHLEKATPLPKVIPTAVVAALRNCSVVKAREYMESTPVIRKLMKEH